MVLNTIVVALDESALSRRVIEALGQLKLQASTKVILCHVFPANDEEMAVDIPKKPEEISYRQVEKQLQAYQESLPCASEIEMVSGDPAAEIVRLAHIHQADLLLIGSRGLTGLNRILKGSVSQQVVEEAPCSVMVVKMCENAS